MSTPALSEELGDSLSIKIWDYDKAANNDLLAEGILDGSQFHKPGQDMLTFRSDGRFKSHRTFSQIAKSVGFVPGGFDGDFQLQSVEPKYAPMISLKVLVREVEEALIFPRKLHLAWC